MDANESSAPEQLELARREYRWLKRATLLAITLACAIPLSLNLVDPDLWGHVQYGQDWLEDGTLPRTASHTFTAIDYPWINHENLAELALATGFETLGVNGMLIAKCLLGMAILFSMVWVARKQQVHAFVAGALMLLVAANLQAFFPLRPQLLSFALFSTAIVLLERAFCDWQTDQRIHWKILWPLPLVFAVWVNAHGGFALGLCVVGAYLIGRILELIIHQRTAAWPRIAALSLLGLSCVAATFANPYGLEIHRWLLMSLSQPRPEITEWAPPKVSDPMFWQWISLLAVTVVSLWGTRRRRDWVQITILTIVAWQSAMHLRHIAFLALLCGYWLPAPLQSALNQLRPSPEEGKLPTITLSPWLRRTAIGALLISICLQSLTLQKRLSDFPVLRNRYPVDALQFMADNRLDGKLVVSFNWAQYAIAALAPDMQVAFDGRFRTCYPQEVVDMHFDFLIGEFGGKRSRSENSGEIDGTKALRHGQPNLILMDRRYKESVAIMRAESKREHPEWSLLYCDTIAEVWGRRDQYSNPAHANYLPLASRLYVREPTNGSVQWPALPVKKEPRVASHGLQVAEINP